ncbi:coiled-coil domain-containing protein 125 [Microtus ochrogaster]|uniref:Coiled-coil domain-containing protein 125 n=1 Tax=Microtus ochrogaster TaxID=79684 RepID=A0ABM1US16_MICOH|nr:coiled-coil domain-containing protein 125 [Microtus ochrogaster]
MSKVTRSPSETEDIWETEEDDMTEGDLGYGLGGRPGGIYEVSCSIASKKRSDGRNLSPPPFPRKGDERSETIFQYSGTEGLRDTRAQGCRASGYTRQSSSDSNSELSNEQLRQRLHETLEHSLIMLCNQQHWSLWFCENDFWIAAGINHPWLLLQLTSVRVIFSAGLSHSIPGYASQRRKKTLGQRLLGMLPSENSSKRTEDQDSPQEVLKMLVDLLNDKEEALAHQRKVSYMLARTLEDKDIAAKKNKDKIPTNQKSPFTAPWQEVSGRCVLCDPAHSNVHVSDPVGCICLVHHPQRDSDCSRTLKRSHSLPSNIF